MLRKIVSLIIIFSLLIVPLFCSCVERVEASTEGIGHCHDDDEDSPSAKHDDSKADHHDHSCDCGHASNAILENLTTFEVSFSFGHNFFSEIVFADAISVPKTSIHFAYLGPPLGKSSTVPLYTKYHSLRV